MKRFGASIVAMAVGAACGDPTEPRVSSSAVPDGWEILIESSWTLQAHQEGYFCVRKTMPAEVYIGGLQARAPDGTHHTVLTVGAPSAADGTTACDTFVNHEAMLFGSGIGTGSIDLPSGVAMHIAAGQQLLLNLHVFNIDSVPITGTSGTLFKRIDATAVTSVGEAVLSGTISNLVVPAGPSTVIGSCAINGSTRIFAIGPHMHQLGTHMKVMAHSGGGNVVLHDAPYSFHEQLVYRIDPEVQLSAGDSIEIDCSYDNQTGATVYWGESSNDEMCFASLFLEPALNDGFLCAN